MSDLVNMDTIVQRCPVGQVQSSQDNLRDMTCIARENTDDSVDNMEEAHVVQPFSSLL